MHHIFSDKNYKTLASYHHLWSPDLQCLSIFLAILMKRSLNQTNIVRALFHHISPALSTDGHSQQLGFPVASSAPEHHLGQPDQA